MQWPTEGLSLKVRVLLLGGFLLLATGLMWAVAGVMYRHNGRMLAAAGISYTLGLRHALDADHISAIDNVTRKLMTESKYSSTVGFWFSTGHSSLVVLGCIALFYAEKAFSEDSKFITVLTYVSSIFASVFLIIIGLMNLWQLILVAKQLRRIKRTHCYEDDVDGAGFKASGLIGMCAKGLFNMVNAAWKMFVVGFIFGLGFDTTASIAAVMATASSRNDESEFSLHVYDSIVLALIFACGMITLDSVDGIMMLCTYKWSDRKVVRRLFFTYLITLISVMAALVIGTIIGLRLVIDASQCTEAGFCRFISFLDDNFQYIGVFLTSLFVIVWAGGFAYYRHSHWSVLEDEVVYVNKDGGARLSAALVVPSAGHSSSSTTTSSSGDSHVHPHTAYDAA